MQQFQSTRSLFRRSGPTQSRGRHNRIFMHGAAYYNLGSKPPSPPTSQPGIAPRSGPGQRPAVPAAGRFGAGPRRTAVRCGCAINCAAQTPVRPPTAGRWPCVMGEMGRGVLYRGFLRWCCPEQRVAHLRSVPNSRAMWLCHKLRRTSAGAAIYGRKLALCCGQMGLGACIVASYDNSARNKGRSPAGQAPARPSGSRIWCKPRRRQIRSIAMAMP